MSIPIYEPKAYTECDERLLDAILGVGLASRVTPDLCVTGRREIEEFYDSRPDSQARNRLQGEVDRAIADFGFLAVTVEVASEDDQQIVGVTWARYKEYRARARFLPFWSSRNQVSIEDISVLPMYQRAGLGHYLLHAVNMLAQERDSSGVYRRGVIEPELPRIVQLQHHDRGATAWLTRLGFEGGEEDEDIPAVLTANNAQAITTYPFEEGKFFGTIDSTAPVAHTIV